MGEIALPVPYRPTVRVRRPYLLDAARRHSLKSTELGEAAVVELRRRYNAAPAEVEPRVYRPALAKRSPGGLRQRAAH